MQEVTTLAAEDLIGIAIIFFVSFIGSFAKVYLKLMRLKPEKGHHFNMTEVVLSSFTATIIIFAFSPYIEAAFSLRGVVFCSFITGLVGFELLNRLSSIKGIIALLASIIQLYNAYAKTISETDKADKDKDNSNDTS